MTQLKLIIGNKNYSSWSLRPWLAMKQFGLTFEEIRISLYTPEASQQIYQYSPSGKVPVLLHRDLVIWDSLAILEYLAEELPDLYWWPQDKAARAIARSISAEMHSSFQALRHYLPMNCRARVPNKEIIPEVSQDIKRITSLWQECRQQFGNGGDFLLGEFTIADAMFAPVVLRFVTYGVLVDIISGSYMKAILALSAMQEWLTAASNELEVIEQFELIRS